MDWHFSFLGFACDCLAISGSPK
ncbi:protein of unknown function [Burkholderia multivorans]